MCRHLVELSRPPKCREMGRWAEEEIIIPNGPKYVHGLETRYKCDFMPCSRLFFNEVSCGYWREFNSVGPTQTGKTLTCGIIPVLWHLFERNETVVFGIPDMEMAFDKWREDIKPVLLKTRYASMIPKSGHGSRGGEFNSIQFTNGATLRFMTGGGGDKSVAGFTSRVLVITEVDGMDEERDTSREGSRIKQLEARVMGFGENAVCYKECTASVKEGAIWQGYENGSQSRIFLPCQHCGDYVFLERKHLVGWETAKSEVEAYENSGWCCSSCGAIWSEEDRKQSNLAGVLVHKGQTIENGAVTGPRPPTFTLGFRWSAVNNLFVPAGMIGMEEWKLSQNQENTSLEKSLFQFRHAIPWEDTNIQLTEMSSKTVLSHVRDIGRGTCPQGTSDVTIGVDTHENILYWTAISFGDSFPGGHIVDYGTWDVRSNELGVESAIVIATRELAERMYGDPFLVDGGGAITPNLVLQDSGWQTKTVYLACAEVRKLIKGINWLPSKGMGINQRGGKYYSAPRRKSHNVPIIGNQYNISRLDGGNRVFEVDANFWKGVVQSRFMLDQANPNALTLCKARGQHEHQGFAHQVSAHRQVDKFVPGKGIVHLVESIRQADHYADATYLAIVAGEHVRSLRKQNQAANSGAAWFTNRR